MIKDKFNFKLSDELQALDPLADVVYTAERIEEGKYDVSWPMERHKEFFTEPKPTDNHVGYSESEVLEAVKYGHWVVLD